MSPVPERRPADSGSAAESAPRVAPLPGSAAAVEEADEAGPLGGAIPARDQRAGARRIILGLALVLVLAVWAMRDIMLLVGYSVLLAYVLLPLVRLVERIRIRGRKPPRPLAAALVMLALVTVVGYTLVAGVPEVAAEMARLTSGVPDAVTRTVEGLRSYSMTHGIGRWLNPALDAIGANAQNLMRELSSTLVPWLLGVFGGIGRMFALVLLPLLAFYLLAESREVRSSALKFVPADARGAVGDIGNAVDRALRRYVRGQALVSLMMGAVVGVALAILGLPVVLLLAAIVAIAEVVPYLGFLIAAVAIAIAGLTVSPAHALGGVGLYVAINWIIATFVSPRVMGRYLDMHPFVVTVAVLAGATLLGPAGALLALPVTAAIQAAMTELAAPPPARPAAEPPGPPVAPVS